MSRTGQSVKPLDGVRVLDLSRMVAGGVAGMLLADFGADVVKVEQPGTGDPLRQWTAEGLPLWWKVYARNKRFVTLNLKAEEGRALLLDHLSQFDVLMESFVPGTLERMGLGPDVLLGRHPKLVMLRISGWGQTGPGSARPGFGTLIEAASGFAAMNGEPDGAPIVPSFPLADTSAALFAANAIMFALYHRDVHGAGGQVIDLALFESLFSLLGPLPAEYAALGKIRSRNGSRSKNAGPARLLPDERRPLGGGERLDAEDGGALPARVRAGSPARRSEVRDQRGARHQRPRAGCRRVRGHRVPHARGEPADHRVPPVDGGRRLHRGGHRARTRTGGRDSSRWTCPTMVARCGCTTCFRGSRRRPARSAGPGGALGQDNEAVYRELGLSCDEQKRLAAAGVI